MKKHSERLTVYRRADGLWAWRLQSANGRIIATDGGQGYTTARGARHMAYRLFIGPTAGELEVVTVP